MQADLAVASFGELSVINLRRLFAHKGSSFMDLQKQIIEKSPSKRKLMTDTIFWYFFPFVLIFSLCTCTRWKKCCMALSLMGLLGNFPLNIVKVGFVVCEKISYLLTDIVGATRTLTITSQFRISNSNKCYYKNIWSMVNASGLKIIFCCLNTDFVTTSF